jgi:eukaryotic-like serine/threonine-protein kinase
VKKGLDVDPDRWPDVSRVFSEAVTLGGPSRNVYLDEACRHDPALRAAVESLLRAHDNAGSFGEAPILAALGTVKRLTPRSQLGPFRIETWLGAGGMGEVYRATDMKLQRAVAIKVLPDSFAQDPNRLARFQEEARALAALNHPHVGAIYGLEESAGVVALVLELVEGPTLAERLAVGPLRFDEVVWIARQLAEGLEAAHERGIVHRDLKPANIKITPDGNVKILDFGLAKAAGSLPGAALTPSPAGTRDATQFGVVLGTVGYMSPEQARGQPVDKRTDIWAFGCVLFEMCARQPPFAGATISDTQAAVVEREPDWELVRADTPPSLVRLLRRCLRKDPKLRLRDIGEARIALSPDSAAEDLPVRPGKRRVAAIAAILGLVALASGVAVYGPSRSNGTAQPASVRFPVPPPEANKFSLNLGRTFFALSPDGSQLAFIARPAPGSTDRSRVWIRALSELRAQPLRGTDGATSVFWSPDGRKLAFFADRKLKRIDLPDGAVVTIFDDVEPAYSHGTWGAGEIILLGRINGTSIDAVPATGGVPVQILSRNQSKGEVRVHWPWFLPDGKRFLYTALLDDAEGEVRLAELRPNDREGNSRPVQREEDTRKVLSASSNAQWVDPDVVVFVREGVLMGQHVDVAASRPREEPFQIAEPVEYFLTSSRAMFSASWTGSVAYHAGQDIGQLVWADRNGNEVGTIGSPSDYQPFSARLSPDDSALLVARKRPGLGFDIWRMNLNLGPVTEQLVTSNRGSEVSPVWIDDRTIVFAGDSPGSLPHLFRKDLATGNEEQLLSPGWQQASMDVFSNGTVAYVERGSGGFRLFQLPSGRGASPTLLLPGPLSVTHMHLSPDERAMTFISGQNEGRMDVHVSTVSVTNAAQLVAAGVSGPARWSRDENRIYYLSLDGITMMTVAVRTVPSLKVYKPEQLFKLRRQARLQDVFRDGRFLLLVPQVRADEHPITVWTAAIPSRRR